MDAFGGGAARYEWKEASSHLPPQQGTVYPGWYYGWRICAHWSVLCHSYDCGSRWVCHDIWPGLEGEGVPSPTQETGAQDRLTQLRALYDQRLITQEEYEEKRKEILKEL